MNNYCIYITHYNCSIITNTYSWIKLNNRLLVLIALLVLLKSKMLNLKSKMLLLKLLT